MVFNLEYQPVESSNRTTYISKVILLTFVIDNALPSLTTHCEGRRSHSCSDGKLCDESHLS